MAHKEKNIIASWGWGENAPEFIKAQAKTLAECTGMRTGEIIVHLGLADQETIDRLLPSKPDTTPTVNYLGQRIDGVAPQRQKIFAIMDSLLLWEPDIEVLTVLDELKELGAAYTYCDSRSCIAFAHPVDQSHVILAFSEFDTLDQFKQMGREERFSNPILPILHGRKIIYCLADQKNIKQALSRGVLKDFGHSANDTNKLYWASSSAESDSQRAVASILNEAIEVGATDVGLTPNINGFCKVTIRLHGQNIPSSIHPELSPEVGKEAIRFLLLKSGADPTSQRLASPKDGAFRYSSPNAESHIRMSFIPADNMGSDHEMISVSARILVTKTIKIHLQQLKIDPKLIHAIENIIKTDRGLILISAPTNNGKSTTVAGINQAHIEMYGLSGRRRLSVEQPVERLQEGMISFSIDNSSMYGTYVRALFRHDLDYAFIGELRDPQSASAFVRIGTSGHMGISTTHATDSISAPGVVLNYIGSQSRQEDGLYVQPSDLVDNLSLSIAQRLVPQLCKCATEHTITEEDVAALTEHEETNGYVRRAEGLIGLVVKKRKLTGCKQCKNKGTVGELPVVEWIVITEKLKNLMLDQLHERGYLKKDVLKPHRAKTLYESAIERLLANEIGLESIFL